MVKLTIKHGKKQMTFAELELGDVFLKDGYAYRKYYSSAAAEDDDTYQAISLEHNRGLKIAGATIVIPCDCEIIITPKE